MHAGRPADHAADRLSAAALAATAAGMVATPLLRRGRRRAATTMVVGGLFTSTTALTARRWGRGRAVVAASSIPLATALVERLGTATGVPFGRYRYTGALRPTVGGVPVVVPLAWFAMAVPAREVAHAVLARLDRPSTVRGRVALGAACLAAWDLFLDPQMVGEGYWAWGRRGRYRGIPLTNYAGWLATGVVVMGALERLLPVAGDDPPEPTLTGTYGFMAAMEALGFAAFFRDPVVAAVGAAGMLAPAVAALRQAGPPRGGHDG